MSIQTDDQPTRSPWAIPAHWRQAAICCGVATALLYIRRPDAFTRPQLWAEDATVFFLDNYQIGWHAIFHPYAGYLHLILRLIAWLGIGFAPFHTPEFYTYCSLACLLLVIMRLFSPRVKLPAKPWLALAIVLVPHSGEVFMNLTNAQWVLALILIQMLAMDDARTPLEYAGDPLAVLLIGLTGPFSILLAPLFAWRWYDRRTGTSFSVFALMLVCAAVQGWFIAHGTGGPPETGEVASLPAIISIVVRRAFAYMGLGDAALNPQLPTLTILTTIAILWGLWLRRTLTLPERRPIKILFWICIVLILAGTAYRERRATSSLVVPENGDRYFYLPKVLLLWLIAMETASSGWFAGLAARAVLLVCFG